MIGIESAATEPGGAMQVQPAAQCKVSGFILNERCALSSKMEVHRYVRTRTSWVCFHDTSNCCILDVAQRHRGNALFRFTSVLLAVWDYGFNKAVLYCNYGGCELL